MVKMVATTSRRRYSNENIVNTLEGAAPTKKRVVDSIRFSITPCNVVCLQIAVVSK